MNFEFDFDYEKIEQIKNLILVLLISIDLIFIVTITFFNLPDNDLTFMAYFDLFVCILLFINLAIEYKNRDGGRLKFIKEHIIDILSIIPFNFIFLRYLTLFRVVRIIQFFQVIRIVNLRKSNLRSFKYFVENQLLRTLTVILVIYIVISSIILYTIDDSFLSIFDSFWYGLVTITGVGYGDITPVSTVGKVIGMLTIIIGVLFISVFTASMSALYMEKPERKTRNTIKDYLIENKEEINNIKQEIKQLKDENMKLNKKIDELTEMLKEKG